MSRPVVRRTYGKAPPRSSSSLFTPSSPPSLASHPTRSSSPPSSYRLDSPLASSPPSTTTRKRASSPLFFSAEDEDAENVDASGSDAPGPSKLVELAPAPAKGKGKAVATKPMVVKKAVQSSLKGFFAPMPQKRKKPLHPSTTVASPSSPPTATSPTSSLPAKPPKPAKPTSLTQMHLTHLPLLHTCPDCSMSFMRGGPDETVHQAHHARVLRGIVWEGLKKGKGGEVGWKVVKDSVTFGEGKWKAKGRVVVVDGSWGGSKLDEILSTVDRVLSSPPLPPPILDRCKIFLFLTASPPPPPPPSKQAKRPRVDVSKTSGQGKERVVSVVVAQGIKWAMRVLGYGEKLGEGASGEGGKRVVESGGLGSVMCDPEHLPTPLGIHRLYTAPLYRSHGLSLHLLDAAREHTVYGCSFDPSKGEAAFSQPTESGRAVMQRWGGGQVRVFVDDESQL
ncbi:hypothetical protein IAT38_001157 [Cryptococcus sp. DSM 104549]